MNQAGIGWTLIKTCTQRLVKSGRHRLDLNKHGSGIGSINRAGIGWTLIKTCTQWLVKSGRDKQDLN